MPNNVDEELYYACMNYCNAYFHAVCKELNIECLNRVYDESDIKTIMEFERKRVSHSFENLKEKVAKADERSFVL